LHFTIFDRFNTPALTNDAINALAEDNDGTLWIGTGDGLVGYRERRFFNVTQKDGFPDRGVFRLLKRETGGVWLNADTSVAYYAQGHFSTRFDLDAQRPGWRVFCPGANGSVQILMDRAWDILPAEGLELFRRDYIIIEGLENPTCLTALPASEPGALWLGTSDGLYLLTGCHTAEFLSQNNESGAGPDRVKALAVDPEKFGGRAVTFLWRPPDGDIWLEARPGGLYHRTSGTWQKADLGKADSVGPLVCMLEDREHNLWLGTEQGLVLLEQRMFRAFTMADGLTNDNVWSICEGGDGTIWLGTDSHVLQCICSNKVNSLPFEPTRPGFGGHSVYPCRKGGCYWSQGGWLYFFDPSHNAQVTWVIPELLPSRILSSLCEDRCGRLWLGSSGGLAVSAGFDPQRETQSGVLLARKVNTWTNWVGKAHYDIKCIFQASDGTIWLGTQGQGVTRVREHSVPTGLFNAAGASSAALDSSADPCFTMTNLNFEVFTTREGLSSDRVWCVWEDARKTIWLGTDNGLTRYAHGRFFAITRAHGLPENAVNCVLEDDFGYLWLSGLRGIYRIERAQLDAVAEGRAQTVEVARFGVADGMESSETNGENSPSGWKARDGSLWFPTVRGAVVVNPKALRNDEVPPPVVLEKVLANGRLVYGDGLPASAEPNNRLAFPQVQLAPGSARILEFRYTANQFSGPEKVRFAYQLEGHDPEWQSDEDNRRVAFYTDLSPGRYQFRIKACSSHGVWNRTGATLAFIVQPFFYQTWPFYALCGGAVVFGAMGVQTYRLRVQRRILRFEQAAALARERERIARDMHDDVGASLSRIALLSETARSQIPAGHEALTPVSHISDIAGQVVDGMSELIWSTNPRYDTLQNLLTYMREYAARFFATTKVRCRLDFPAEIPDLHLGAEFRRHVFLILKEALNNIQKHSDAKEAEVRMRLTPGYVELEIHDNGCGLSTPDNGLRSSQLTTVERDRKSKLSCSGRNGVANMQSRAQSVGGELRIESPPGAGTRLLLRVPFVSSIPDHDGR
jgi:signal transduction histidine kinase/ligand-binding sensor domain-containing protein